MLIVIHKCTCILKQFLKNLRLLFKILTYLKQCLVYGFHGSVFLVFVLFRSSLTDELQELQSRHVYIYMYMCVRFACESQTVVKNKW